MATYLTKDLTSKASAENTVYIKTVLRDLVDQEIQSVQSIEGGRNSRTYLARCISGERLAVKWFSRRDSHGRDPMAAEFAALKFLWGQSVTSVPQPVTMDEESHCSVYSFVDGDQAASIEITTEDIDQTTDFLGALRKLTGAQGSNEIAGASEACFSVQDALDNVRLRLTRLQAVKANSEQTVALHRYLTAQFVPFLETITVWASAECKQLGITLESVLPMDERTLSPSDLGFHNAIRTENGLVFLDFEHFGWDDPAKTISDFVLHPAMDLSRDLKQRFITRAITALGESGTLAQRLPVVYPLFGLKWCMIFLNEFLKEGLERRQFAAGTSLEADALQAGQLVKSKYMLQQMAGEYEHFPYNV